MAMTAYSTISPRTSAFVVKELLSMHHGDISVQSEPGKGSCFTIQLLKGMAHYPADTEYILSDLQENAEATPIPEEQPLEENDADMQQMLIVEDNHELRAFIKQVFEGKFRLS